MNNLERWQNSDLEVTLEPQPEFNTWKVVNINNEAEWWGGFKTRLRARIYAVGTLKATIKEIKP